ncbi:armadillo-type protein [Mycena latifolia]|nr:armadillo-type protein [Mycena latifolia]
MPPLTRQQTYQSILSCWSDSNPSGATINLHAAAKPLMRLMYHRQALGFVKRNRGVALSRETVEIYLSYVLYGEYRLVRTPSDSSYSWKYVSTATKLVILEELKTRARSEEDAHVLISSNTVNAMIQLLRSSPYDMHLAWPSVAILRELTWHTKSASAAVIESFVALLRRVRDMDDDGFVVEILSEITASQASAFVKRHNSVPLTPETVEIYLSYFSGDVPAESSARWKYVSTSTKIVILKELAIRATSEEDVLVLIHSNMVDSIFQLLQSASYDMRSHLILPSETILRNVASHSKSTSAAVIEPLVALLQQASDSNVNDVALGFDLLWYITNSLAGAEGVVAAGALLYCLDGLGSLSSSVRCGACRLIKTLVENQSTAAAVIDLNRCKQLVALSRQVAAENYEAECASHVLVAIADWPDGAEAVVAVQVLDHVPKWFTSPRDSIRQSACRLVGNLARHKSTVGTVMDPILCTQLVTVLELSRDVGLIWATLNALGSIAKWPDGAEDVVAAKALNHITKSLESRDYWVRESTCDLLAALARHESTVQAVVHAVPREHLVALSRYHPPPLALNYTDNGALRDECGSVQESADKALQALDNYLTSTQAPTDEPGKPNVL